MAKKKAVPSVTKATLTARERLDTLIAKARVHLYKPLLIAEILYRDRTKKDLDLTKVQEYNRVIPDWKNVVCPKLLGQKPSLNWRYLVQVFDESILPPSAIVELALSNRETFGAVEVYIYRHLQTRFTQVAGLKRVLSSGNLEDFRIRDWLLRFEHPELRRSVDKAYEITVYALFDTLVRALGATVTLAIDPMRKAILADFAEFSQLVLGIAPDRPQVTQPARLYRVGVANAADAGLDMWANFGPAVQVKHMTLSLERAGDLMARISADQVLIVCQHAEAEVIATVLKQVGMAGRIRGFITELDLVRWYEICLSPKYAPSIGRDLLRELLHQFDIEFPAGNEDAVERFLKDRGYSPVVLAGPTSVRPV